MREAGGTRQKKDTNSWEERHGRILAGFEQRSNTQRSNVHAMSNKAVS